MKKRVLNVKAVLYQFRSVFQVILFCLVFITVTGGCSGKAPTGSSSGSNLKSGLPADIDPRELQPGLKVHYRDGFWRNISQMPRSDSFTTQGRSGKPVYEINHQFGTGEVFDSGKARGVGVQMEGFIELSRAGTWHFKAKSNDGIDIRIAQIQVAYDPDVHSDRFSQPGVFDAPESGWYPLLLRYFQRKGTATLEFYWQPPGEETFSIIPGEAYRH